MLVFKCTITDLLYRVVTTFKNPHSVLLEFSEGKCIVGQWT